MYLINTSSEPNKLSKQWKKNFQYFRYFQLNTDRDIVYMSSAHDTVLEHFYIPILVPILGNLDFRDFFFVPKGMITYMNFPEYINITCEMSTPYRQFSFYLWQYLLSLWILLLSTFIWNMDEIGHLVRFFHVCIIHTHIRKFLCGILLCKSCVIITLIILMLISIHKHNKKRNLITLYYILCVLYFRRTGFHL